jgi:hypothetical protein
MLGHWDRPCCADAIVDAVATRGPLRLVPEALQYLYHLAWLPSARSSPLSKRPASPLRAEGPDEGGQPRLLTQQEVA